MITIDRAPNYALNDKPIMRYIKLPDDLLKYILKLLRIQDLARFSCTSRGFYVQCSEDCLWNRFKECYSLKPPHIKYQLICQFTLQTINRTISLCMSQREYLQQTDGFQASGFLKHLVKNLFEGNLCTGEVKHKKMRATESYTFKLTLNKIRHLAFKNSTISSIQIPKEATFWLMTSYRSLSFETPLTINSNFLCNKIEICDDGSLQFEPANISLLLEPKFAIKRNLVKAFLDTCMITDS